MIQDVDTRNIDVDEEDQSALEESFDMTREEAKTESATSFLLVILSLTMLIFPFLCQIFGFQGVECSESAVAEYVFFAMKIAVDIYAVIKPGIYAITDKEFRERYKQLSPFACCCFRRIRCPRHTVVPRLVGTPNTGLSSQEGEESTL